MPTTPKVNRQEVLKIAHLAKLALKKEEVDLFTRQFNQILDYMDQLNAVDTSGVEPLSHVLELVNVTRPDEPEASLDLDTVLENAPASRKGHFAVPPVLARSK